MRLEGKASLVTGAGSGIGRAIALGFAREGARVMVAELDEPSGQATARDIEKGGAIARFLRTDVSKEPDVAEAVQSTVDAFGRLDIMVNNAGIAPLGWENWDRVIAVNLSGVFYGCKHAAEAMARTGGGVIINLASILGLVGAGLAGPYVVSKHGVVGITREFALATAAQNIRVNCLCPGWIETPMLDVLNQIPEALQQIAAQTPMSRMGRPDEVARAAVFLASEDSSFMTGAPLILDGGWTAR
jgi:NAD(P)-dependent dehydrogenase (short-subunit alcohol dehydrogenase family)